MKTIQEYNAEFQAAWIPQKSKKKYRTVFSKYENFLRSINGVEDAFKKNSVQAFIVNCVANGSAPSSIISYVSIIKSIFKSKNIFYEDSFWTMLYRYINDKLKGYIPINAPTFEHADACHWFRNAPEKTPVEIQKKCAFLVAYAGVLRVSENHNLTLDNVLIDFNKNEIEIKIEKSKNQKSRSFFITDPDSVKLLLKYIYMIPHIGKRYLWAPYNVKYKKFNKNQRRGQGWLQNLVKDIAKKMCLPEPDKYSHHSFRKSGATAAVENGCTEMQARNFGSWSSTKVLDHYVSHSKQTKRKVADAVLKGFGATERQKKKAKISNDFLLPSKIDAEPLKLKNEKVLEDLTAKLSSIGILNGTKNKCNFTINFNFN